MALAGRAISPWHALAKALDDLGGAGAPQPRTTVSLSRRSGQIAWNPVTGGRFVAWTIVPALSGTWCLQRLPWRSARRSRVAWRP